MRKTFALFFVVLSLLLFSCSNNTPSVDETPINPDTPPLQTEVVKYTVSFSGDVEDVESITVEKGKAVSLPEAIPLGSAKTFKGWSTVKDDASFLIEADTYTPSGDITLYAIVVDCEHAWVYNFLSSGGAIRSCVLCNEGPQTIPETDIVEVTVDDAIYNIDKQIKEAVFYEYSGTAESVTIPEMITTDEGETYPVTSIDAYAFSLNIKSVTISEGIKAISEGAFCDTGISSIKLPESLLYIGDYAFTYTKLVSLDIPKNVRALGSIYSIIFASDELESITVASENAYFKAEDGMLLSKDGKTLYAIVPSAEVRIPGTVKNVMGALLGESTILETLIIEDGVETIGEDTFSYCEKLTSITIPKSMKEIKAYAFSGCTNLTEFRYEGTTDEWGRITLSKNNNGTQNWATDVGFTVINCADGGEVTLNNVEALSE